MVFLYCFLRLNLKTRILAARSAPTMVPVTLPPETSSPPSWKDALTASCTSEPMSPASFSTRITSPGATRYCFPPVSMIACMQTSLLGAGTHEVCRNRWSKEPVYYIGPAGSNPSLVSYKMSLEGGAGFSYKMSLEARSRMLGFDHQRADIRTIEPGANPGIFENSDEGGFKGQNPEEGS